MLEIRRVAGFVLDLMDPEPTRLDLVKGQGFGPADFVIRSDGVCRLNPEMARLVVAKVST